MKHIIFLLIGVFTFANFSFAQEKVEESTSRIPKELKGQLLHVEKYSAISRDESTQIAEKTSATIKRDEYLKNVIFYNLIFRRKINNQIESVFDNYKLDNIKMASTRDIKENLDNNIRFILKAEFSAEDLIKGENYSASYYIYDQEKNIRYKSFRSLEMILKSLRSFNWYADNRITAETTQVKIDEYVERNLPNERKPFMSSSTRTGIIVVLITGGISILGYITG